MNYTPFNYNSLYQINQPKNKSYISKINKYKNSRSKIPIKQVYHNYNSISKLKNINNSIDDENKILYNNDLKSYQIYNTSYNNSIIKNYRFNSFGHLSLDKSKPEMNIMINNGIIKNIIVNKKNKDKMPIKINRIQNNKQSHHNNFYNNFNKIKEKLYNDYNRTFQKVNQNMIIRKYNENSNFNSASKNNKIFEFKSFNGKKLLKNNKINNNNNKIKQIPIGNNYNSQRRNSYGNDININYNNNLKNNNNINNYIINNYKTNNNNIINNQNKKNIIYKADNFFSKTNIYETKNNNIKDNILFEYKDNNIPKKIKMNNNTQINKHQSFNKNNLLNNNKLYNYTENNILKNNYNLISSSSSSDFSNELSALAEDIINIQKQNKIKNKINKKNNLKEININKNLEKDFNINKENKKNTIESTEDNFDLIDQIIHS